MKQTSILFLILLFSVIFIFGNQAQAQRPYAPLNGNDCDHTHPFDQWLLDGDALNVQPGDVVCLETSAGERGRMHITNMIGTPSDPIIIKNAPGQLVFEEDSNYSIWITASSDFRLTGTGDPNHFYGIRAGGSVKAEGLSTNFEIDHVEVYFAGFAGFMIKTDPNCNPDTWRENFTMRDVSLHDNYAHNMEDGEGFYVGFTFYNGYDITCDDEEITVYGHVIEGLHMYNNRTYNTGSEGIQVGSTPVGADIHDNVVINYGQRPFANYQANGVQIGAGTGGKFYNNWIERDPATSTSEPTNGLMMFGQGDNVVYNNVILNTNGLGIFADERGAPVPPGYQFINNTIVNTGDNGISIYADEMEMNHIKNNIIVNPGSGVYVYKLNNNVPLEMENNLFVETMAEVGFVDAANNDFHLLAASPAVDDGLGASSFGVFTDFDGEPRPYGDAYDIGAFEFVPTLRLSGTPANETINLRWEFNSVLPPGATWRISYNGTTGDEVSPIEGIASATRSYSLTGMTNYETYEITIDAMDGTTVLFTDTIEVMPTDIFVYLPTIQR